MSYTRVYEEMFEFNFIVGKSSLQEKANFGDCLGAWFQTLIWRPGDKKNLEKSKIWSLTDYPKVLTALLLLSSERKQCY